MPFRTAFTPTFQAFTGLISVSLPERERCSKGPATSPRALAPFQPKGSGASTSWFRHIHVDTALGMSALVRPRSPPEEKAFRSADCPAQHPAHPGGPPAPLRQTRVAFCCRSSSTAGPAAQPGAARGFKAILI